MTIDYLPVFVQLTDKHEERKEDYRWLSMIG